MGVNVARISELGDLVCFAGEALRLQLRIGEMGAPVDDLTGRIFSWIIYRSADRTPLRTILGNVLGENGDSYVEISLPSDDTASLFDSERPPLRHQIVEQIGGGENVDFTFWVEGKFSIQSAGRLTAAGASEGGGVQIVELTARPRAERLLISARGGSGKGAAEQLYAANLIDEPTVPAMADFLAAPATEAAEQLGASEITGEGLVKGGGPAIESPALRVEAATTEQALAGVASDVAMTPAATKAATDQLGTAVLAYTEAGLNLKADAASTDEALGTKADAASTADALAAEATARGELGLLTGAALDQRVRVDQAMGLSSSAQAIARANVSAPHKDEIPVYPTRAAAQAITIPASVRYIQLAGYAAPGDGGDAKFARVDAEPAHPGKLQDAAGAWFEQRGPEWRPEQFGSFRFDADATSGLAKADACAASQGGFVRLRAGVWFVVNFVQTCNLIAGDGRTLTYVRRAGAVATSEKAALWSYADNAATRSLQDLTIDGLSANDNSSLLSLGNFASDVLVLRCGFKNGIGKWALRGDPQQPFYNLEILECVFENLPAGAIAILCGVKGNRRVRVNKNVFRRVGNNVCQVIGLNKAGYEYDRWDSIFDVEGNDNTVTECLTTGNAGAIPFEFWGCTGLKHFRNTIDSGTRGIAIGVATKDAEIAFNTISNQSLYAFEAGLSRDVWVHHNTVRNCRALLQVTSPHYLASDTVNLTVEDITFTGTGLSAYTPANPADIIFVFGYAPGLRIRRIKITSPEYARYGVYTRLTAPVPQMTMAGGTGAAVSFTYKAVRCRLFTGAAGTGYTAPTVAVIGGGGTGMAIAATVANGQLTGATVTNPGTGYKSAPKLVVSDPTGTGGELEVLMGLEAPVSVGGAGYPGGAWTASEPATPGVTAKGTYTVNAGVPSGFVVTDPGEGFGRVSDAEIEDVTVLMDTYLSTPCGINAGRGNTRIIRPKILRTADLDANHYLLTQTTIPAVQISYPLHASNDNAPQSIVEAPDCGMQGQVTGTTYAAIAVITGAQPAYGFELRRGGKVYGNFTTNPIAVPDSSGTARIETMDVSGLSVTPYNLNASILRRRTGNVYEGTGVPTVGTYRTGDISMRLPPSAATPMFDQCVAGGSPGIWVSRLAAGANPVLPSAYALISTFATDQSFRAEGSQSGTTFSIRCEALAGAQPYARLVLRYQGRNNEDSRGGEVIISWASYTDPLKNPVVKPNPDDPAYPATYVIQKDAAGRREVVITLPTNGGAALQLDGLARVPSAWASYSISKG